MNTSLLSLLFGILAQTGVIFHDVESTNLIKSGEYRIETVLASEEEVNVKIHYELKTQWFAPIKDQVGDLAQVLPVEYSREQGYLNLEKEGSSTFKNVTLHHLGRSNEPGFRDSHHIRVVRQDGSWEAEAWYHPSIRSTGWSRMNLTLKKIPVLGDYTLRSKLRNDVSEEVFR